MFMFCTILYLNWNVSLFKVTMHVWKKSFLFTLKRDTVHLRVTAIIILKLKLSNCIFALEKFKFLFSEFFSEFCLIFRIFRILPFPNFGLELNFPNFCISGFLTIRIFGYLNFRTFRILVIRKKSTEFWHSEKNSEFESAAFWLINILFWIYDYFFSAAKVIPH